jgi:uncharacterized protein YciI
MLLKREQPPSQLTNNIAQLAQLNAAQALIPSGQNVPAVGDG